MREKTRPLDLRIISSFFSRVSELKIDLCEPPIFFHPGRRKFTEDENNDRIVRTGTPMPNWSQISTRAPLRKIVFKISKFSENFQNFSTLPKRVGEYFRTGVKTKQSERKATDCENFAYSGIRTGDCALNNNPKYRIKIGWNSISSFRIVPSIAVKGRKKSPHHRARKGIEKIGGGEAENG